MTAQHLLLILTIVGFFLSSCNALQNRTRHLIVKRDRYGGVQYDCYNRGTFGFDYSGKISWTQYGKPCIFWNSYGRRGTNYYSYRHNYCRNPDRKPGGPWCYYDFHSWSYCDVPICDNIKGVHYKQLEHEKKQAKRVRYYTVTEYITRPVYVPYTRTSATTTTTTITAISRSLVTIPITARSTSLEVETMTSFRTEQTATFTTITSTTTKYADKFGNSLFPDVITSFVTTTESPTTIFITATSQTTFDITATRTITNFHTITEFSTVPITTRTTVTKQVFRTVGNDGVTF